MCLLQKFLNLTYLWTFFIFYQTEWTCWVFLLVVRRSEHLKEIQAFEAAIWCLGDQSFILNDRAEIFFLNFSVANMAENAMQWELQTMI